MDCGNIDSSPAGHAMAEVLLELVDEIVVDIGFEVHADIRQERFCLNCDSCRILRWRDSTLVSNGLDGVVSRSPMYCDCRQDLVDRRGYDCFGQSQSSTSGEPIDCPHCGQKTGATRFAAHLARCMGGGGRTTTRQSRAGPSPQQV